MEAFLFLIIFMGALLWLMLPTRDDDDLNNY